MIILALLGSYGLKGGNALPDFSAFALWTLKPFLFVLRHFHDQGKFLIAFFADEFVRRHDNLLGTYKARRPDTPNICFI